MPFTLFAKGNNDSTKQQRLRWAIRVADHFCDGLPDLRLLVCLDDVDCPEFRSAHGPANRGFFSPTHRVAYWRKTWPQYLREKLVTLDRESGQRIYEYDCAVYLYHSTCRDEAGLTMTLAHELQHFVQYGMYRRIWSLNTLISNLSIATIKGLGLTWRDLPIEREARIVAKCATVALLGAEQTRLYVDWRRRQCLTPDDVADCDFIQQIDPSQKYNDLNRDTLRLFQLLTPVRAELENLLSATNGNPDFDDLDLAQLFEATA